MPFSTIDRSSDYFRIKLYTGNGSTQSITFDESKAMQPDLTWIKVRNDANVTLVHDVIRGATKEIYTPLTNAEATDANGLTAFNSNGFSVGSAFGVNRSGYNFVNWSWKANGAGASNTSGTITSTVSANTTSGFSIVSYTGNGNTAASVGHGLGVTPAMMIIKKRSATHEWTIWHKSLSSSTQSYLQFDTLAAQTSVNTWGNTAPTSSLFYVGPASVTNGSSATFIAYCFSEVKGFSKAFSYTGNGSSDGVFVNLGFRPAWILIKCSSSAGANWQLVDNRRSDAGGFNVVDKVISPNASDAEYDLGSSDWFLDILSNGFKLRNGYGASNTSGATYIGFAIAESPFVSSKGVPVCAR